MLDKFWNPKVPPYQRLDVGVAECLTSVSRLHSHRIRTMDYAAAAAKAPALPPASGTDHAHYPHPYAGYSPYGAYHQPAPATHPSAAAAAAASSSYYYPVPAAVQYDPYSGYQHCNPPEGGDAAGAGLVGYYFTVGTASQQAAVTSTTQAAPAATTKEAGKQFGFDPQRYAQVRTPCAGFHFDSEFYLFVFVCTP